ncbi:MAG: glycosyltransferase family 2 protein [Candidatus Methanoperedens sp.]|nr:glycosyltransferase family 2 protein [Candidatus Methanoperedens sp.]
MPAFNEQKSIGSVVLFAKKYVDEVIVVDDGSTDRTSEIATLAGAKVKRLPFNEGKGAALKVGFEGASRADIIITLDGDGQHDPEEIPKLMEPIIKGESDFVIGSRYINGNRRNTPLYRRAGQILFDWITNKICRLHIRDTQSGFRAFSKYAVPVFSFRQKGMVIESEMLMDASRAYLRINEVEIAVKYVEDKLTLNLILKGLNILSGLIFLAFNPFKTGGLFHDNNWNY